MPDTTSLLELLRKKKFAEVYKVVRENPKLVDKLEDGESPFQWACRFGDTALVSELIKYSPNLNKRDENGDLPIEAVADGSPYATAAQVADRTAMVTTLLRAKAPLGNALEKACTLGAGKAREMVKLLIAAKANADFLTWDGSTILHVACEYDHPEAFEYGLQVGIDVNAKTSPTAFAGGSTALHYAVKKRRTAMVEKLVAAGAKVDVVNKRKESPLTLANGALRAILEGKPVAPKKAAPKGAPKKGMADLAAQLWKAPRDRELLGVYADGLIEQGETSRGEYIRLALLDKPTAEQTKRKEKLLKERGKWLGDARALVSEWVDSTDTPGFVASATTSVDKAIAHLDELAALGPELTLRVTPIKTRLLTKKLAELPLGKTVYGFHFYNTAGTFGMNRDWVDDTSMAILGPALAGVRHLTLAPAIQASWQEDGFTPAAFESLAPVRPTLISLTFDCTEAQPRAEIVQAIAPAMFPALHTLTFIGLEAKHHKSVRSTWSKTKVKVVFAVIS